MQTIAMARLIDDPLYYSYEGYLGLIIIAVPVVAWFLIRGNRLLKAIGLAVVVVTTIYSLACLKDAVYDTRKWYPG